MWNTHVLHVLLNVWHGALSEVAQKAWKRAGQPDPIRPRRVAKQRETSDSNYIILDSKTKIIKLLIMSIYLLFSIYNDRDFDKTLQ